MNANELKSVLEKNGISVSNRQISSVSIDVPMELFNGSCLKKDDEDAVFLVMNGKKCLIPNMGTFKNLFNNTDHILHADNTLGRLLELIIDDMETGTMITDGALLIKSDTSAAVFLLTNNKKYGITSSEQFNACHFSWKKIKTYPQVVVEAIPNGDNCSFDATVTTEK